MAYLKRRFENWKSILVARYLPDHLYSVLMNLRRHTLCGERLHISRQQDCWVLSRGDMRLYSHTPKMTGFGNRYFSEKYEAHVRIEPGDTVLDVGACIGDTTLPMALRAGPEAHVIAVEPHPVNARFLRRNLEGYRADIHEAVVGTKEGTATLHVSEALTGHGLQTCKDRPRSISVQCITLNRLASSRKIDFAKIDVQGSELDVLQTGADEFLRSVRKLVVETHYCAQRGRLLAPEVKDILQPYGFRIAVDTHGVVHCAR